MHNEVILINKLIALEKWEDAYTLALRLKARHRPMLGLELGLAEIFLAGAQPQQAVEALMEELRHFPENQTAHTLYAKLAAHSNKGDIPPPAVIPPEEYAAFTLHNQLPVLYEYHNDTVSVPIKNTRATYKTVIARIESGTFEYYEETLQNIYDALAVYDIADSTILIFGLAGCNCDAIALWKNAKRVIVVDYNVPELDHPNILAMSHAEFAASSIRADFAFSISSFEHDGLGRYGDPINPDGDIEAMRQAKRCLKPGGIMFLAVPLGRECLVWNAYRIYGPARLPLLLQEWKCINAFGGFGKCFEAAGYTQPVLVLANSSSQCSSDDIQLRHVEKMRNTSNSALRHGKDTHNPALAVQINLFKKITSLQILRTTTTTISPQSTIIATFSALLGQAAAEFSSRYSRLPDFFLVDWDGGALTEEARTIVEKLGITLFSQRDAAALTEEKTLCVYAEKGLECHIPLSFAACVHALGTLGIASGYLLDAATCNGWERAPEPDFFLKRLNDITTVYAALADEQSREVLLRVLRMITSGDKGFLPCSAHAEYHHPKVLPQSGDVIIDGGVENGETALQFSRSVGKTGKVYGFEPVSLLYEQSLAHVARHENIHLERLGLWSVPAQFHIENRGEGSFVMKDPTEKSEICRCVDLDSYLFERREICDLIKLDIEGAEEECLKGAINAVRHYRPKLQISIYHENAHYLDIPLMLIRENLGYSLYMEHHSPWRNGTILYACPPPSWNRRMMRTAFENAVRTTKNDKNSMEYL